MSDDPPAFIASYHFTINGLLRSYRELTGLSQDQLAALSVELMRRGDLDRHFTQSAIARWEKDPTDGGDPSLRVKKLQDHILVSYATLLEHALRRVGFEGADQADLLKHLRIANERKVVANQVSQFALEIDALMAPWPRWLKEMAQKTIREVLVGMGQIYERYRQPPGSG